MAPPKGFPKPPTSGRRAGTPNKNTVRRERMLKLAREGTELPHDALARMTKLYVGLAEDAFKTGKTKLADHFFGMAADFANKAAPFFAPKLSRGDADLSTGDVIVNLVQYDRSKIPATTPKPDLLLEHHHPQKGTDDDDFGEFDDPAPIRKQSNGGDREGGT